MAAPTTTDQGVSDSIELSSMSNNTPAPTPAASSSTTREVEDDRERGPWQRLAARLKKLLPKSQRFSFVAISIVIISVVPAAKPVITITIAVVALKALREALRSISDNADVPIHNPPPQGQEDGRVPHPTTPAPPPDAPPSHPSSTASVSV
ncbi:hypothetical protein A1Q1_03832 [Trichosporon asahii var. asahii CBS 2479]|uniref:Uncharacterized protein n=1 Tax=Trichosporon asahii var. asahii (strain ATCC 90039 / CBS 2479 / JCM 2466 / KCTC 7840 / NBRC 103889/ NCYC 2677 / UAMH 7654) TaxID=1186058 RepID=J5SSW0_TRIAS|nr:hypothetical protein A1Q1_03832 [Trichosporon asahii var. asahii CBS 2479]EJT47361.1 hypothetical protein A1Q1_03832 [Trichosporon asahii var. asahii CBS 2479]